VEEEDEEDIEDDVWWRAGNDHSSSSCCGSGCDGGSWCCSNVVLPVLVVLVVVTVVVTVVAVSASTAISSSSSFILCCGDMVALVFVFRWDVVASSVAAGGAVCISGIRVMVRQSSSASASISKEILATLFFSSCGRRKTGCKDQSISNEAMNEGRKECIKILQDTKNGACCCWCCGCWRNANHEDETRTTTTTRCALLSPAVTHSTSIIYVTVERRTARIPPLRSSTRQGLTGRARSEAAILCRLP
jgi:hypothetical protein